MKELGHISNFFSLHLDSCPLFHIDYALTEGSTITPLCPKDIFPVGISPSVYLVLFTVTSVEDCGNGADEENCGESTCSAPYGHILELPELCVDRMLTVMNWKEWFGIP